jgi:hypothetical protein
MNTVPFAPKISIAWLLLAVMSLAACDSGTSAGVAVSEKRVDGKALSSDDEAAAEFVRATLAEHWLETPDGWTTQFQQYNVLGELMPDLRPNTLYKQIRVLSFTIASDTVTEAMKLNGTDYRVTANFKDSPTRLYRIEADFDGPQGWGNWQDSSMMFTRLAIERRNGTWIVSDSDLFEGIRPDPAAVPR